MSRETSLLSAVADYVVEHEANRNVVDVNAAALELSSSYPESGLTIDQIAGKIERCAVLCGATILSGYTPKPPKAA